MGGLNRVERDDVVDSPITIETLAPNRPTRADRDSTAVLLGRLTTCLPCKVEELPLLLRATQRPMGQPAHCTDYAIYLPLVEIIKSSWTPLF